MLNYQHVWLSISFLFFFVYLSACLSVCLPLVLLQVTVGVGKPWAWQGMARVDPRVTDESRGDSTHVGGTVGCKQGEQRETGSVGEEVKCVGWSR